MLVASYKSLDCLSKIPTHSAIKSRQMQLYEMKALSHKGVKHPYMMICLVELYFDSVGKNEKQLNDHITEWNTYL